MIYFLNKTDSKRDPFWSHIIYILFVVFDLIYLLGSGVKKVIGKGAQ